jgi:hypothetical protein
VTASDQSPIPINRPPRPGNWEVVARSGKVANDWKEMTNSAAGECQRVYDKLQSDPNFADGDRQHPLEGEVGRGSFMGMPFRRWQIDVTAGSRIWYFIDSTPIGKGQKQRSGRVILDRVLFGHPKSTEKKPSRKVHPGRN